MTSERLQRFDRRKLGRTLVLSSLSLLLFAGMSPAENLSVRTYFSTAIDTTSGSEDFTKLPSPVFRYHKRNARSILKVTYQDSLGIEAPAGGSSCAYQVRVDDQPSEPAEALGSAPILSLSGFGTEHSASLSSSGVFRDLPKGFHLISIWHRKVGPGACIRNAGGGLTTILVEEIMVDR